MNTFKKIWFVVLFALLLLPASQALFHFVDEKPLDGAFVEAKMPVVKLKTLFNETVQDSLMTWCTEKTGFRKSMIRLNNQLLYSAFGKVSAIGPVKGKDGEIDQNISYQKSLYACTHSSYPLGLFFCHLQESSHISRIPYCAVHPSSFLARDASA